LKCGNINYKKKIALEDPSDKNLSWQYTKDITLEHKTVTKLSLKKRKRKRKEKEKEKRKQCR
jgi:hypothetical protein